MGPTLWGIDLGGTKVEGVVVSGVLPRSQAEPGTWEVLARLRLPTEAELGYEHILGRIGEVVEQLEGATGLRRPERLGVGTPGSRRQDGRMKNCNTTCLNGRALEADLGRLLGCEVALANDADCFALAEAVLGAGRGHRTVFGVIMGTGVGGGVVVDGRLLSGPNGLTGEWGHVTLVPGGRECYCGRRGCVERYLSGPAVEEAHRSRTGEPLALAGIVERSGEDAACAETVRELCLDFGRALATVVNVLDPDAIVLGGGVGQVPQLMTWGQAPLAESVFGPDFTTPLLLPELGDSAGVFGAALLAG